MKRQLSNAMTEEIIEEFGLTEEFDIVPVVKFGRTYIGHKYFATERVGGLSFLVEREKAFTDIDYDRPLGSYLRQYKIRRGESDTFQRVLRAQAKEKAARQAKVDDINHEFGADLLSVFKRKVSVPQ